MLKTALEKYMGELWIAKESKKTGRLSKRKFSKSSDLSRYLFTIKNRPSVDPEIAVLDGPLYAKVLEAYRKILPEEPGPKSIPELIKIDEHSFIGNTELLREALEENMNEKIAETINNLGIPPESVSLLCLALEQTAGARGVLETITRLKGKEEKSDIVPERVVIDVETQNKLNVLGKTIVAKYDWLKSLLGEKTGEQIIAVATTDNINYIVFEQSNKLYVCYTTEMFTIDFLAQIAIDISGKSTYGQATENESTAVHVFKKGKPNFDKNGKLTIQTIRNVRMPVSSLIQQLKQIIRILREDKIEEVLDFLSTNKMNASISGSMIILSSTTYLAGKFMSGALKEYRIYESADFFGLDFIQEHCIS